MKRILAATIQGDIFRAPPTLNSEDNGMLVNLEDLEAAASKATLLATLEACLVEFDRLGLSIAAIYLDHAIALLGERLPENQER